MDDKVLSGPLVLLGPVGRRWYASAAVFLHLPLWYCLKLVVAVGAVAAVLGQACSMGVHHGNLWQGLW